MKRVSFSNFFFQFILILLIDLAFGVIVYLTLSLAGLFPASVAPLGAEHTFIVYDNLLESFLAVVIIHFFRSYGKTEKRKAVFNYLILAVLLYFGKGFLGFLSINQYRIEDFFGSNAGAFIFRMNLVWTGLSVYYWIEKEQKSQQNSLLQSLEVARLQELKVKAELEALQAKINPHFLYNALNSIANLINDEPQKAQEMTYLLSRFFRFTTNPQSRYYTHLSEEIAVVETYLAIEKIRFGVRLDYAIRCADEQLLHCLIPQFLIQPLVENAIKHGTSKIAEKGILGIQITEAGEWLELKVYDNGALFEDDFQDGYGLRSVHEKLKLLGGDGADLTVFNQQPPPEINCHEHPTKYVLLRLKKKF
ncbi:MAG: histidine kinase [Spirosomataceae bacterium]